MNIISALKAVPFVLAATLPASLAAQTLGVAVPSLIDATHLFGAFVVTLTLLTLSADYRAQKPLPVVIAKSRSVLPLAA